MKNPRRPLERDSLVQIKSHDVTKQPEVCAGNHEDSQRHKPLGARVLGEEEDIRGLGFGGRLRTTPRGESFFGSAAHGRFRWRSWAVAVPRPRHREILIISAVGREHEPARLKQFARYAASLPRVA